MIIHDQWAYLLDLNVPLPNFSEVIGVPARACDCNPWSLPIPVRNPYVVRYGAWEGDTGFPGGSPQSLGIGSSETEMCLSDKEMSVP